ncbi:MAG: amidohydrolase family protein [Pseudomonadota bacterium]|nr:amidohydrolase family protein [Pseudomonadota bacterium]
MIIDAHVHLWRLARGDNLALTPDMAPIYRDREPGDLRPLLDRAGIDRVVVVQAAWTIAETLFTIGLSVRFPWIAGIIGWADLTSPSLREEIDALLLTGRLKGIRPVDANDNRSVAWLLDDGLQRGWDIVAAADLPVDLLVQDWREVPVATALARRRPGLRFVLDHCGKPDIAGGRFQPWASSLAELARLPNVACKLSGLVNCAAPGSGAAKLKPYTDHVLACFGPERVLWASDWPPLDLAADYATWKSVSADLLAPLSVDARQAVFGRTAEELYRLEPPNPE